MKLREKFRRFWTMDVHNHEGFTLVELIIVIAILAILSGVAVVGYSSYVEKANISADKALVAEIVNLVTLANYDSVIPGVGSIVLSDGDVKFSGDEKTKAWLESVLTDAYGSLGGLKVKYNGWGNGAAVAQTMFNALTNDKFNTVMNGIYGDAGNLSFTEDIPELLEEIRKVATDYSDGDDAASIFMLNAAAGVTSGWTVDAIKELWTKKIAYNKDTKQYSGYDSSLIPDEVDDDTIAVTMAGLLRAKNTCIALYVQNKNPEFAKYYTALSSFSVSNGSIRPYDLTKATNTSSDEYARLKAVLNLDDTIAADRAVLYEMAGYLGEYENAPAASGNGLVRENDAVAYAAMMGIVDTMAKEETVQGNTFDEYMNSVSGAAAMFQKLVEGSLTITELEASLTPAAAENNVTITIVPNNGDVLIICSPTAIRE